MKLSDVTKAIEQNALVECAFGRYRLNAIISRFKKKTGWYYQLELKDLKANGVVIAPLEEVDLCE